MTSGYYVGGTWGSPWGGGGGLYFDSRGRAYPQGYLGTPGWAGSAGYTPDLEGLLTGPSISGTGGRSPIGINGAISEDSSGIGIGTPGVGATYGIGPYEMSDDFSRPLIRRYISESAARAGVPSRNNVFEYGFPEPDSSKPLMPPVSRSPTGSANEPSVFDVGTSPVPYLRSSRQDRPGGLLGMMIDAGQIDPPDPYRPPVGGLAGLIQDYIRSKDAR